MRKPAVTSLSFLKPAFTDHRRLATPPASPKPRPPPQTPKKPRRRVDDSDDDISFADALGVLPQVVTRTGNDTVLKQKVEWITVKGVEDDGNVMIEALQDRILKKYYVAGLEPLKYVFCFDDALIVAQAFPDPAPLGLGARRNRETGWSRSRTGDLRVLT
jgi:hypothetical protein